ncbi:hypothetical protein CH063_11703, partial [Colletotrichum higginsianum]
TVALRDCRSINVFSGVLSMSRWPTRVDFPDRKRILDSVDQAFSVASSTALTTSRGRSLLAF